jgi:hypothetical protein
MNYEFFKTKITDENKLEKAMKRYGFPFWTKNSALPSECLELPKISSGILMTANS